MICPTCAAPTRVKATRSHLDAGIKWVSDFGEACPSIVMRRRHCDEHGTFVSIEVPLEVAQMLIGGIDDIDIDEEAA